MLKMLITKSTRPRTFSVGSSAAGKTRPARRRRAMMTATVLCLCLAALFGQSGRSRAAAGGSRGAGAKPSAASSLGGPRNGQRYAILSPTLTLAALNPFAQTITVKNPSDSGGTCPGADCTLRQALAVAASGDTIDFDMTSMSSPILLASELPVSASITIQGPGTSLLAISGNQNSRVLVIAANTVVTISGLTITSGKAPDGSNATTFGGSGGNGGAGGGIFNNGGTLTLTNCSLTNNRAGNGGAGADNNFGNGGPGGQGGNGGGIFSTGTLELNNTTVSNDSAGDGGNSGFGITGGAAGSGGWGGGIYSSGILHVSGGSFNGNAAGRGGNAATSGNINGGRGGDGGSGGGIYDSGGALAVTNVSLASNTAGSGGTGGFGGGIGPGHGGSGGNGGIGGGICTGNGLVSLTGSVLNDNHAGNGGNANSGIPGGAGGMGGHGGGLYNNGGNGAVTDSTFSNNTAGFAGNSDLVLTPGTAGGNGGGIYHTAGTLTIERSTLNDNSTGRGGDSPSFGTGGVGGNGGEGGGISNGGALNLIDSTLSANKLGNGGTGGSNSSGPGRTGGTGGTGGGIINFGTLLLVNDTIVYNNSATTGLGGAGGPGTSTGSTGASGFGGGIRNASGTVNVRNTIVAKNIAPLNGPSADLWGSFITLGHNLIGQFDLGTASGFVVGVNNPNGDRVGGLGATAIDPQLGSLQDNGGPTQTVMLGVHSLALDAGDNCVLDQSCATNNLAAALTVDQRGVVRPQPAGGTIDIGAVEATLVTNAPDLLPASDSGSSNSDNVTKATDLQFQVTGAITGATVELLRNTTVVATGIAGAGGIATVTYTDNAADGVYNFSARQRLTGFLSPPSDPLVTTIDRTPVSVTVNQAAGQADPTKNLPINFAVGLSEPVVAITSTAISLSGSTANVSAATIDLTGSGTTFNAAVANVLTGGTVQAAVPANALFDAAGNANLASNGGDPTVTYDITPPNVTIEQAAGQADPSANLPINFSVVFTEPVTGFTGAGISLAGSTANVSSATFAITGAGTTYNVAIGNVSTSGTVVASIKANAAVDAAGNANLASTSVDHTVTFDSPAPSVTINQAAGQADPANAFPLNFTVVFSQAVTGLSSSGVSLAGSSANVSAATIGITGSGTTYTVAIGNISSDGTVKATIMAGAAVNVENRGNLASTSTDNSVFVDITAPAVTIDQAAGQPDPTSGQQVIFTVLFSEPVTDFTNADISLAGSTADVSVANVVVTGSGSTYSVAVNNLAGAGTVQASVLVGAFDVAGNVNTASTSTDNVVNYNATPLTMAVNSLADPGDGVCDASCTLRDAVTAANNLAGAKTINFDLPSCTPASPCTITLTNGELAVAANGAVIIHGPGANVLRVNGNNASRVFSTSSGAGLIIFGLTITGGRSNGPGGGINNLGALSLVNSVVSGNSTNPGANAPGTPAGFPGPAVGGGPGGNGGGINSLGALSLTNSAVVNNATGSGGAGQAFNNDSQFFFDAGSGGNGGHGGGIYNPSGSLILVNSTVSNNVTGGGGAGGGGTGCRGGRGGDGGSGGGVYNTGIITLVNSTLSGNSTGVGANGGSTVAGAQAPAYRGAGGNGGNGGGLGTSGATLLHGTIANNHTGSGGAPGATGQPVGGPGAVGAGGGILMFSGPVRVRNSIVAINTVSPGGSAPDISGSFTSLGHNLIGNPDGSDGFTNGINSDQVGTSLAPLDPRLGLLADNGGPTFTHALLPNSPARNAGDNCVLDRTCANNNFGANLITDQRGVYRPQGNVVDIGAYEFQDIVIGPNALATATAGVSYSQPLTANGGMGPYSFSAVGPLPDGLSISSLGVISGIPTQTGVFPLTVMAQDANLATGVRSYSLSINLNVPTIDPLPVNRAAGSSFAVASIAQVADPDEPLNNLVVKINGGASASVNGVSISNLQVSGTGLVTGFITSTCGATVGTAGFTLTVTDSSGTSSPTPPQPNLLVSITANSPPVLTYGNPPDAFAGRPLQITPAVLSDNGSIASVALVNVVPVSPSPAFTGTVQVNNSGTITLTNPGPLGAYDLNVRATDNCGGVTDTTVRINVVASPPLLVNDPGDSNDAVPGNGSCADAAGKCTLRAAVQETNTYSGGQQIDFAASLGGQTITLSLGTEIQIASGKTLTINGLGANQLTIDGGSGQNRIFYLNGATVTLTGMTLQNGNGAGAVSTGSGGAIMLNNAGRLVLDSMLLQNNTSGSAGGAIALLTGTNHRITNSTFRNNNAGGNGGAISGASMFLANTTISGNTSHNVGGGIYVFGPTTIRNSTITLNNNAANAGGGGIYVDGTVNLGNTIVAANTSNAGAPDIQFGSASIQSAGFNLIGNNTSVTTQFPTGNPNGNGDRVGGTTPATALSPSLTPLGNFGGPTPTHALLPASIAIDHGSDALAVDPFDNTPLSFDQRGTGFPRKNGTVDIGAFEKIGAGTPPTISDLPDRLINQGSSTGPIEFTIGDAVTPAGNLIVAGNSSNQVLVPAANIVFGGSDASRTVTVTPAAGQFGVSTITIIVVNGNGDSASDTFVLTVNGAPTVSSIADQVTLPNVPTPAIPFTIGDDVTPASGLTVTASSSNQNLVPDSNILLAGTDSVRAITVTPQTDQIGTTAITVTVTEPGGLSGSNTFSLLVVPPLVVNNVGDAADANTGDSLCDSDLAAPGLQCSLRAAIQQANALASADAITFAIPAASCPGGVCTITLGSEIPIANNGALTITGTGANQLVIDGGPGQNRIFHINGATVTLTGMTLQNGNGAGAVSSGWGGAIMLNNAGRLVMDAMLFQNNTSLSAGGAVVLFDGTNHRITNSTFRNNNAGGNGGALSCGSMFMANTTISGNTSHNVGGGIYFSGPATIRNSTITLNNNAANAGGGGFYFDGAVNLGNSIVAGNSSTGGAPDIQFGSGSIQSAGFNLIGNNSSVTGQFPTGNPNANGDRIGVATGLAALANNGGPTPTHAVLATSNALNHGSDALAVDPFNNSVLSFDQRGTGFPRRSGTVDIGAFEFTVNTPSTISSIGAQSTNEDVPTAAIPFTVGDAETLPENLTVTAASGAGEQALVPNADIVVGGSGADRTVTITPAANRSGLAHITVSVSDGVVAPVTTTFDLTINPVNDAPAFNRGADQFVPFNSGLRTVNSWATNVAAGPADESGQALTFNVTDNTNPGLFSAGPAVSATGTLTFTPAANTSGTATIGVTLSDDGSGLSPNANTSAVQTFTITVYGNTITWAGSTGGDPTNWGLANNWSPGFVPVATNDIDIPAAGVASEPSILAAGADVTVNNLNQASGRILTIENGRTLTVTDLCTVNGMVNVAGAFNCGSVMSNTGTVNFTGAGAQAIPTGTYNNLTINNPAGFTLTGDVTVTGVLTLSNGPINTGAFTLTVGSTGSIVGASASSYVIGKLKRVFEATAIAPGMTQTPDALPSAQVYPVGTASGMSPVTINATAGGGNLAFTVSATESFLAGVHTNRSIKRYWTLTPDGITQADLTFQYLDTDVPAPAHEANFKIIRRSGAIYTEFVPTASDITTNTFSLNGVTDFSDWTIGALLTPTAAGVSVSGRVMTPTGQGLTNARVVLTGSDGVSRTAVSSSLGYFRFDEVSAGRIYVLAIESKRYVFTPQVVTVSGDLTEVNFIAQ